MIQATIQVHMQKIHSCAFQQAPVLLPKCFPYVQQQYISPSNVGNDMVSRRAVRQLCFKVQEGQQHAALVEGQHDHC